MITKQLYFITVNIQPKNWPWVRWKQPPIGHVVALALLFLLTVPHPACAQRPGLPDSSFGQAGWVRMDLGQDEYCSRLLVDAQGRIWMTGSVTSYAPGAELDYFIARRLPDGQTDGSFGVGGMLRGDFPGHLHSRIVDMAVTDDAVIFIGEGYTTGALDTQSIYIGKVDFNGNWVAGFGQGGLVHREYVGRFASAGALMVLPDERILYCGSTSDTNTWHIEMPMVARLLPDGRPDSTFGGTGIQCWSLRLGWAAVEREPEVKPTDHQGSPGIDILRAAHNDGGRFQAVQVLSSSYLLGGFFYTGSYSKPLIIAVDENGLLCDGFGQNGVLMPEVNPSLSSRVVAIGQRDEDIFLALQSEVYQNGEDMALLQMDSNGTTLQYETIDLYQQENRAQDMLIDREGRIVLAGYSRATNHNSPGWESDGFALAARQDISNWANGWADGGQAVFSGVMGMESGAFTMTEAAEGGILVAGYVNDTASGNYSDLLLLRLQGGSGTNSTEAIGSPSLLAYPNPVVSGGLLHFSDIVRGKIQLIDLLGHRLELEIDPNGQELQIPQLIAGIYILQFADTKIRLFVR